MMVGRGAKRQGRALLRSLLPRLGDPRDRRPAAAGLPDALVLQRRLQALGPDRPALPARLHRQVLGALRGPGLGRGAPRDRRRLLRLHGRPDHGVRQAPREGDVRRLRRAGLRAGRPAPRRPRRAQPGAGEAGRRARRRHRRRRRRRGRGPARGRRADLLRPRRPGPRPARLGGRQGRRRRHRGTRRAASSSSSTTASSATRSRARCSCPRSPTTPRRSSSGSASCAAAGWRCGSRSAATRRRSRRRSRATRSRRSALHKTKRASDLTTRNRALEEIQLALELATAPLRIECYDISNLQGTEVVGSMVVFEDGLARKSDYRRFVIKGVEGQNDVASMHEVITRRFRRLLDERAESGEVGDPLEGAGDGADGQGDTEGPMLIDPDTGRPRKFAYAPGLVVVDGGPPQVAAAQRALDELGIDDIPVVGLAKRLEEVWLPGQEDPVILPRTSEGLYLLQRIRDEAHRFAITHHRSRRSKSMVESLLDDVPGLGEVRRKSLLKRFGSLKKLRAATVDEIAEVPGIGRRTAEAIVDRADRRAGEAARRQRQHRDRRDRGVLMAQAPPEGTTPQDRQPPGRARRRHGDDRSRAQHRRQGARGPRLLRGRQPAADAGARRGRGWWTRPRGRAADRGRRRRALRVVLRRPPGGSSRTGRPGGAPPCSSSRPTTTCWCAGRRPRGGRTRSRRAVGCSTASSVSGW